MCLSPEGGSDSGNSLPSPLRDFGAGSYPAAEPRSCLRRLSRTPPSSYNSRMNSGDALMIAFAQRGL
jgi:hypothetical protein